MREYKYHLIVEKEISLDDLLPMYSDKELIITDMSSLFRKKPRQWVASKGQPKPFSIKKGTTRRPILKMTASTV